MVPLEVWFDRYGESHRHPVNRALHTICVPVIAVAIIVLLSLIPVPWHPAANLGSAALVLALILYVRLSVRHAAGIAVAACAILFLLRQWPSLMTLPIWVSAFIVAWVGQFIGHAIEGKRPSFLEDLRFLLIGPLWVLEGLYRRLGISRCAP
jgi:uncharacterized membrane protein YGL010W